MIKILIIGGNAAGLSAAVNARKENPKAKITVISREPYNPYRRPAIPAIITGEISAPEEAAIFSPGYLKEQKVDFLLGIEAVGVDLKAKSVKIRDAKTGGTDKISYDSLVLCMGGYSKTPEIKGTDKRGVCTFTTYDNTLQIIKIAKPGLTAVVIGAGFVGLEIAEALMKRELNVYFNVRSRILRRLVEPDFSAHLHSCFERKGLKMLTGESISEIGGGGKVEYIVMKGEKIETPLVVFGVGVRPNVIIAKNSGIDLGKTGAIKVDKRMETSERDVYAAGDCAESLDLLTGRRTYSPVGSIAALAGAIAGTNAAGGRQETKGFIRAQADKILDQQIISIGHSSTTAKEVGLEIKIRDLSEIIRDKGESSLSGKYPVKIKVLTESADRVVGAQVISPRYASQYSYELYNAILQHKTFKEFISEWKPPLEKVTRSAVHEEKHSLTGKDVRDIGLVKW